MGISNGEGGGGWGGKVAVRKAEGGRRGEMGIGAREHLKKNNSFHGSVSALLHFYLSPSPIQRAPPLPSPPLREVTTIAHPHLSFSLFSSLIFFPLNNLGQQGRVEVRLF